MGSWTIQVEKEKKRKKEANLKQQLTECNMSSKILGQLCRQTIPLLSESFYT
jgi:hypothetical protein